MSLSALATVPLKLSSCPSSSRYRSSSLLIKPTTTSQVIRPFKVLTKNHRLVRTICEQKQPGEGENQWITQRRSAIVGLGVLAGVATGLIGQSVMATESPNSGSSSAPQPLPEFGPEPRPLNSTIRVFVPRAPKPQDGSGKDDNIEVLVVDGVEVKDNNPVRMDVYIAKAEEGRIRPDLGELAGSLVDLARWRVGRKVRKLGLNLGITYLVKEIGAQECEKLLVSLVPRTGDMVVGGVHIENVKAE